MAVGAYAAEQKTPQPDSEDKETKSKVTKPEERDLRPTDNDRPPMRPQRDRREQGREDFRESDRPQRPAPRDEERGFEPRRQRNEGFAPRPQMRQDNARFEPQFSDRQDFRRDESQHGPAPQRENFDGPRGPRPEFPPQREQQFSRRPQFRPEGRPPMPEMRREFDRPTMNERGGERMGPPPREFAMGPRDRQPMNQGDRFAPEPRGEGFAPRPQMRREGEHSEQQSSERQNFRPQREDNHQFDGPPSRRMQSPDEARPHNDDRPEGLRQSRPPVEQE